MKDKMTEYLEDVNLTDEEINEFTKEIDEELFADDEELKEIYSNYKKELSVISEVCSPKNIKTLSAISTDIAIEKLNRLKAGVGCSICEQFYDRKIKELEKIREDLNVTSSELKKVLKKALN